LTTKVPLQDSQGQVTGLVGVSHDITERKLAEEALEESQHRLKTILEAVQAGIIIVDTETREVIDANPAALQMIGADRKAVIGTVCHQYICPAEQGSCPVCDLGQTVDNSERVLLTAQGKIVPIIKNVVPVTLGNRRLLIESFVNIAEQKRAEESLQEALRRSQLLYNISEALTTMTDQQAALETVLGEYLLLINLGQGSIALFDQATGYNRVQALYLDNKVTQPKFALEATEDLIAPYLSENPFPLVIEDVQTHPLTQHSQQILSSVNGMLVIPLIARGEVVGTMSAEATEKGYIFSQEDIEAGKVIADQLAIWLENRQLMDETQHRSNLLATGAKVSSAATSILDLDGIINTSVNLIRDQFDFYYVGLFLVDNARKWAVLRAGTGEAGRIQVEKGHRLEVGGESMIGWSVANRQARIALDVGEDAVHFQNPYLPDTSSEMALPLISRDEVIGALTVQSVEQNAFSDDDITVLQTMADQLANAIANARLFDNVMRSQKAAETLLQETQALQQLSQALASTLQTNEIFDLFFQACTQEIGFEYVVLSMVDKQKDEVKAVAGVGVSEDQLKHSRRPLDSPDIMADIVRTGKTEIITGWDDRFDREMFNSEGHADWVRLFLPIVLRRENVGLVEAGFNINTRATIEDSQIRLLRAFIDQTALALDNARRYEASKMAARREALIKEITAKVRASTDLDKVLRTTVKEVGDAIGGKRAYVHLISPTNGETETQE
jgi:PAS domain S-box-containing protein